MKEKITIAGKIYMIDVEKAKRDGYLYEESPLERHNFQVGDVFKDPSGSVNPFLLVKTVWRDESSYQTLGLGCMSNSDDFHKEKTHTIDEIREYLIERCMVFDRNINLEISELVKGRK